MARHTDESRREAVDYALSSDINARRLAKKGKLVALPNGRRPWPTA